METIVNAPTGLAAATTSSLLGKAYQLLERKITRLELSPGSALVEKVLMEQLRIGRTPIREALQRLSMEGLVYHLPNRGMFVSEISATNVQEIYEYRALIDGYAACLAASRATREQVGELRVLQRQLEQATDEDDIDRYVTLDRCFYQVLAAAAHNHLLAETIPRIFNLHLRLWFFISKKLGEWHPIARSHEEMTRGVVDAIEQRDSDRARRAMETYIQRRHQDIRSVL